MTTTKKPEARNIFTPIGGAQIGMMVRQMRDERHMTLEEASRLAKISITSLHKIEAGRVTSPGLDTLLQIASAFGVQLGFMGQEHAEG